MAADKKKRTKKEPLNFKMLLNEFDTVEERLEYIFSNIDFDRMKKSLSERPRRGEISDKEMNDRLSKFLASKK